MLAAGVVALYSVIYYGVYKHFAGFAYGSVVYEKDFCFIPKINYGSWLAAVLAPYVAGLASIVLLWVGSHHSRLEWGRHDDLLAGRSNQTEVDILLVWQLLLAIFWGLVCAAVLTRNVAAMGLMIAAAVVLLVVLVAAYIYKPSRSGSSGTLITTRVAPEDGPQAPYYHGGGGGGGDNSFKMVHLTSTVSDSSTDADHINNTQWLRASPRYISPYMAADGSEGPVDGGYLDVGPAAMMRRGPLPTYNQSYLPVPPRTPNAASSSPREKVPRGGVIAAGGVGAMSAESSPQRPPKTADDGGRRVGGGALSAGAAMMPDDEFDDLIYALHSGGVTHSGATAAAGGGHGGEDGDSYALHRVDIADTHL
jgi:hypothetical protein